ncbi:hypothetical protein AGMMS4957_21610 [Bacteroidia bacterium]|nr:hypothetical protein AGMMS4957_21610 [Bacteroidia bacterium]
MLFQPLFANEPDSAYVFAYEVNNGLSFAWSIDQEDWHSIGPEHKFLSCDYGRWGSEKKMHTPFLSLAADGGLYAELIQNRDFEYTPEDNKNWNATTAWHTEGTIDILNPIHPNNPHYIVLKAGDKLINDGFDGIPVKAGEKYDFSLFPQKTFKNRKNGLRADLAQVIADMQPKFVRFPGGCVAHGDGIENIYRWENTIGALEARVPQRNIWGYHQTAGLGYFEYFQFCEDIGAEPLLVVAAGVPCQNFVQKLYGENAGDEYLPGNVQLNNNQESVKKRIACSVVRDSKTNIEIPAYSFTVIRIKTIIGIGV